MLQEQKVTAKIWSSIWTRSNPFSPLLFVISYKAPLLEVDFCIDLSDNDQITKECSAKISHFSTSRNGRLVQAKGNYASFTRAQ